MNLGPPTSGQIGSICCVKMFLHGMRRMTPLMAGIVLWETLAFIAGSGFFPHLTVVIVTISESFWSHPIILAQGGGPHGYSRHILITLLNFLLALGTGTVTGFILVLAIFQWEGGRRVLSASLEPLEIVPPLLAIPIALSVAGVSWIAQLFAGSVYAFVASSVLLIGAFQRVPTSYIWLAKLSGAKKWWIAWNVYVPATIAESLASLKAVAAFTLGIVIVLEYLAGPAGIGRVMKQAISFQAIDLLIAGVFWTTAIGITLHVCLDILTRYCLRWSPKQRDI